MLIEYKIAVICRSVGLEYDDRIRKECISIAKHAEVKIFATFENNVEEEGITSYGIPYKSYKLKSREKFRSGRFLIIKACEFYFKVKPDIKGYDLIWAHEEYTFLFPLFAQKGRFIWDLHEIPKLFDRPILRNIFYYIEKKSKYIIHANEFRIKYLKDIGLIRQFTKHDYIKNYPDTHFTNSIVQPHNFKEFLEWLNGYNYVYLQGLTVAGRYPYNSIASVLEATDLKIVVVGSFEDIVSKIKLEQNFGSRLIERVFFAGKVSQLAIPSYLKNAVFSIIFYDNSYPNNEYCEANRFYQAINFGIPVITGSNISMSSIVKKFTLGISLESDGRDIDEIKSAIKNLLAEYEIFKNNCKKNTERFVWKDSHVNNKWDLK
jgi:hypothetical protein